MILSVLLSVIVFNYGPAFRAAIITIAIQLAVKDALQILDKFEDFAKTMY